MGMGVGGRVSATDDDADDVGKLTYELDDDTNRTNANRPNLRCCLLRHRQGNGKDYRGPATGLRHRSPVTSMVPSTP